MHSHHVTGHGGMDGGGGMDHGGGDHGGHGDMVKCAMNMLWNTQIIDTCVVFPEWHIGSNFAFVVSFFIIVGLGVSYEWLRNFQRRVDINIAKSLRTVQGPSGVVSDPRPSSGSNEVDSLLTGYPKSRKMFVNHYHLRSLTVESDDDDDFHSATVPLWPRLLRAVLYGSTIFLSFFLMLVFMTYNAYLILAVVLGAALGHFVFGKTMDLDSILAEGAGKTMACH